MQAGQASARRYSSSCGATLDEQCTREREENIILQHTQHTQALAHKRGIVSLALAELPDPAHQRGQHLRRVPLEKDISPVLAAAIEVVDDQLCCQKAQREDERRRVRVRPDGWMA